MQDKVKRVGVVCGYSFPQGLAATTRILTYSKGLVENNIKVDIFIFFPTDNKSTDFPVYGEVNHVQYHYPHTRIQPKNKFLRLASHGYYCLITILELLKQNRKERFDFVILSADWFRILYTFIPIIRLMGSQPIFIADEFPTPIRVYLKDGIPKLKHVLFSIILKYVKGMIFMTEKLSQFYNGIVKKPSFILPTVTDVSRFSEIIESDKVRPKYLCYMGNMELSKDNVDNIIKAFKIVSNKHSDLELHLYGSPSAADFNTLESLISDLGLKDKVFIKGKISNDKVPVVLANSYVLLSSQPATMRAQGGFPTKLGEYMAVGRPTLLTDVGEISKYITDGENAWLARPNDPEHFAEKLEYIIDNYTEAMKVAENGKKYILQNFDYKIQAARLVAFFNNLLVPG